jgi:hypothetical protein
LHVWPTLQQPAGSPVAEQLPARDRMWNMSSCENAVRFHGARLALYPLRLPFARISCPLQHWYLQQ